eukprot:COSAG02_NODE_1150_length_14208_cov_5.805231_5_plen_373_part_00
MIEVREIGPIAEAYPALHMRLGEFHSKRHAKEQQRLAKMLEDKATELGVSADSMIIAKIKERAEALIENSKLMAGTQEVMAALKIQRVYRGMRYRKELRRQLESKMVENGLDLDREAEKLLRKFSKADIVATAEPGVNEDSHQTTKSGDDDAEHIVEVARKSWRRLAKSRAEFQRQYQKSHQQPAAVHPTLAQIAAKLDVVAQASVQLENKLTRMIDTQMERNLSIVQEMATAQMADFRNLFLHPTFEGRPAPSPVGATATAPATASAEAALQRGLDKTASDWLHSNELGELQDVLGSIGTSLSDLATLTTEDVNALRLKTLTRRRLRGHLSQLKGSKCVPPQCTPLDGQQLQLAIEQQLESTGDVSPVKSD